MNDQRRQTDTVGRRRTKKADRGGHAIKNMIEAGLPTLDEEHWEPRPPKHELCWAIGDRYPRYIIVTHYEENRKGERRLVESKTLKVVEE